VYIYIKSLSPSSSSSSPTPTHTHTHTHPHTYVRTHVVTLVHKGLLEVSLNGRHHGRVGDAYESAESGGPVEVTHFVHILGQGGGDDDHVGGLVRELLDEEVEETADVTLYTYTYTYREWEERGGV